MGALIPSDKWIFKSISFSSSFLFLPTQSLNQPSPFRDDVMTKIVISGDSLAAGRLKGRGRRVIQLVKNALKLTHEFEILHQLFKPQKSKYVSLTKKIIFLGKMCPLAQHLGQDMTDISQFPRKQRRTQRGDERGAVPCIPPGTQCMIS